MGRSSIHSHRIKSPFGISSQVEFSFRSPLRQRIQRRVPMKHHSDRDARSNASVLHRFGLIALFVSTFTGCSGTAGDSQFAAESYDEYKEPLVNALVGTPSGLVTIGPDGGATLGSGGAGNSGDITLNEGGIAPEDAGGFED